MKLTKKQRENLGKIVADIGKLFLAIIVLGQWVSPANFSKNKFIFGLIISTICFVYSVFVDRGGE